jgi:hypothetical protein
MKRLITLLTLGTLLCTLPLLAVQGTTSQKPLTPQKIQRMDKRLTQYQAVKRDFKNRKEFQYRQKHHSRYKNRFTHKELFGYVRPHYPVKDRQKGYRYSKRGWELAYRYDRADFFDRYGYHYGYFNRYGYYFEGVFYRYDRFYRYIDRVRGKELFGRRFYMPENYRYYGFNPQPYR